MSINIRELCLRNTPPSLIDAVTDLIGNSGWYMFGEEVRFTPECTTPLAQVAIKLHQLKLLDIYNKNIYLRQRKDAYNAITIGDQLDMIYWDKVNNTTHWTNWITSIKNQYIKPIEE